MIKHHDQSILGRKRFTQLKCLFSYAFILLFIVKGSQEGIQTGQEPGRRRWCKGQGVLLLTGLLLMACSVCLLTECRATRLGMAPAPVGRTLPHEPLTKKMSHRLAYSQSAGAISSIEASQSSENPSFCLLSICILLLCIPHIWVPHCNKTTLWEQLSSVQVTMRFYVQHSLCPWIADCFIIYPRTKKVTLYILFKKKKQFHKKEIVTKLGDIYCNSSTWDANAGVFEFEASWIAWAA